jgi:hypothetical protein
MPRTRIGNIEMYYEVHGSGEPVVLIHGLSIFLISVQRTGYASDPSYPATLTFSLVKER